MSIYGFFSGIMSAFDGVGKRSLSQFSDLETTDGGYNIIAKDGSFATVLRIDGIRRVMGNEELRNIEETLKVKWSVFLKEEGHAIQVWFARDPDLSENLVKSLMMPSRSVARQLNLDLEDIFSTRESVLPKHIVWEGFYVVLWTRTKILSKVERKELKVNLTKPNIVPSMNDSQDFMRASELIKHRHDSFVSNFRASLEEIDVRATMLQAKDAIKAVKWSIYPELINQSWEPSVPGTPPPQRLAQNNDFDMSHMLWPRLDDQLFIQDGEVINSKICRVGSYFFAPMNVEIGPQDPQPFGKLVDAMIHSVEFPWRVSFLIEGAAVSSLGVKAFLASIMKLTNTRINRPLADSIDALKALDSEGHIITKLRMSFTTWSHINEVSVNYDDNGNVKSRDYDISEIEARASRLEKMVESWGNMSVSRLLGDPIEGAFTSACGLSPTSTANYGGVPIEVSVGLLPWNRDASPWQTGPVLFRTEDGRPWPYQPGSSFQDAFINLFFATSGKGKSVLTNSINMALCLSQAATSGSGGVKLPHIAIIDIGSSSSGLISLLRESLPPHRKNEVMHRRMTMTPEYAINPCDTQLGNRKLLPYEKQFLINFMTALATDASHKKTPLNLMDLMAKAIDVVYDSFNDKSHNGNPKMYQPRMSSAVDRLIKSHNLKFEKAPTWWQIVDELFKRGEVHGATLAQRFAVPLIEDFTAALRHNSITDLFGTARIESGEPLINAAMRAISSALTAYPILSRPTRFDIGEARVVSIDLNEVAQGGSDAADKQTALMYMLARFALAKNFYLSAESESLMTDQYKSYHANRIRRLVETPKLIMYDEFHRTRNTENVRRQVVLDMREGRKFGVHISLISQMLEDFDNDMIELATGYWILGGGNDATNTQIKTTFNLNETSEYIIKRKLNGPGKAGAPFLVVLKLKKGQHEHLLYNTLGSAELWAFSTTPKDAALRSKLYEQLGAIKARKRLSERFPNGSAIEEIERRINLMQEDSAMTGDELEDGVVSQIADEIIKLG